MEWEWRRRKYGPEVLDAWTGEHKAKSSTHRGVVR